MTLQRLVFMVAAVLILGTREVRAQHMDTLLQIEEIIVLPDTIARHKIDASDLVDFLQKRKAIFIKDYGPSNISTLSLRGGNAAQAGLYWNGIPINNPMLALTDVSLLEPFLFDEAVHLNRGLGIGNLLGGIDLRSGGQMKQGLVVYNELGSFGRRLHGLRGGFHAAEWSAEGRLLNASQENDFPYVLSGGVREVTEHARVRKNAATVTVASPETSWGRFRCDLWAQEAHREIPKLTTQSRSLAVQDDATVRYRLSHGWVGRQWTFNTQAAISRDKNHYRDPDISIDNENLAQSIFASFKASRFDKAGFWFVHVQSQFNRASSDNYAAQSRQHLDVIDLGRQLEFGSIRAETTVGVRSIDRHRSDMVFHAWLRYALAYNVEFSVSGSRVVRYPGMNDLFWVPGGRRDLLPETAFRLDAELKKTRGDFVFSVGAYQRWTDHFILWVRESNGPLFVPSNLAKVHSWGFETDLDYRRNLGNNWQASLAAVGHFGRSLNKKEVSLPVIRVNDQLFYTPAVSGHVAAGLQHGVWALSLVHRYTSSSRGLRFDLDPYRLTDLQCSYAPEISGMPFFFGLEINNIFAASYRVVEYRPMPGRNFIFKLKLSLLADEED